MKFSEDDFIEILRYLNPKDFANSVKERSKAKNTLCVPYTLREKYAAVSIDYHYLTNDGEV